METLENQLRQACKNGDDQLLEEILDSGFEITDLANELLLEAVVHNHVKIVKLLIRHGAADMNSAEAFERSCWLGKFEIVELFICGGFGIDSSGQGFLNACYSGHTEIAEYLLNLGCDKYARSVDQGQTALHQACVHPHIGIIVLLLKHNFDVNLQNDYKATALHNLCFDSPNEKKIVEILLEHGIDINICDSSGRTALALGLAYRWQWQTSGFLGGPDDCVLLFEHGSNYDPEHPILTTNWIIDPISQRIEEIELCSDAILEKCSGRIAKLITDFSFGKENLELVLQNIQN